MAREVAPRAEYGRVESESERDGGDSDEIYGGDGSGIGKSSILAVTFIVGLVAAFFAGASFAKQPSDVAAGKASLPYDYDQYVPSRASDVVGREKAVSDADDIFSEGLSSSENFNPILGMDIGSCGDFMCDSGYVRGRPCQCTSQCAYYNNCCPDYRSKCKNKPGSEPTPATPEDYGKFKCESSLDLGEVVMAEKKGIAIDDTTFESCADQVPYLWPNTKQKVLSVRLFKAWGQTDPKFFHGDKHKAWQGLKGFAQASGAKFLLGVSVTCRHENDEREWASGREFIKYVGAEHILGIAVGNEIDLQVGASNGACINDLWNRGGYLRILQKRVDEFEALDPNLKGLPITAVLSMFSMNGYPFKYTVTKFLQDAWKLYGDRFKFSINVYPQFSGGLKQAGCGGSINVGTKFSAKHPAGFIPAVIQDIRKRLFKIGTPDMKIWLGEHGWATHAYCVLCGEACHSKQVQQQYYANFLKWDLSASDVPSACGPPSAECANGIRWAKNEGIYAHPEWYPGLTNTSAVKDFQIHMAKQETSEARSGCSLPCDAVGANTNPSAGAQADHVFYFTLRDSSVFGSSEAFGIVERCGSNRCKFQR